MRLWRISNYADLRGLGGLKAAARWHHRGAPVVYTSETLSGALLEMMVHLEAHDLEALPDDYQLLEIEVPKGVSMIELDEQTMPEHWKREESFTRKAGSQWLSGLSSSLLRIPSAIAPHSFNVLINPLHPDSQRLIITAVSRFPLDERLLKGKAK